MKMSSNKKLVAVVLTTAALSIGSVGVATASQGKSTSVRTSTTKTTVNAIANPMAGQKMDGREAALKSILAGLVTKGTITQAQSDAITAAVTAARVAHEADRDANEAAHSARRVAHEALIASTIGIDAATIKTRLQAGETLGAIAGAKKSALITALVAEATKDIDAAVTAGKMTAAQATTLKSGLTARVTAQVDSVRGEMGPGKGGPGMGGRGHGNMDGGRGMGMKP
jgi:polyhydroxyalkanoate synthesis regulator phasin